MWWLIAVGGSIWLCGSMGHNILTQWQENPVKLSLTEKEATILDIPFPTITICPEIKSTALKIKWRKDLYYTENRTALT